ncbi:MAG: ATP-binding protein [Cellulomonas sp.]|nr:ATP-binding protein [Cellulomonas sp.]
MSPRPATTGRDVSRLLADFGHDLPAALAAPPAASPERLFRHVRARGDRRRGRGWAPASAPVVSYQMTSDQAGAFWPFVAGPGLPQTGAQMGADTMSGTAFYADPIGWVLRDDIPVTNANVITMGKPGTGKSATTKAFALRMTDFGYRILILGDPKDEYEPLCRFFGVDPIALGPGMPARVNPLAFGPLGDGWDRLDARQAQQRAAIVFSRWLTLVRGLVGSQRIGEQRVPFGPSEEVIVKTALRDLTGYAHAASTLTETTIPRLWHHLDEPSDALVEQCRFATRQQFLDESRLLRDALGQLVSGALAGLFDDHTNIAVDWTAPIQSLSLSRLSPLGDEAIGIALLALNSWGRGMREIAPPGDLRVVVRDEVWRVMRLGVDAVKSLDEDFRLSRGVAGKGGDIQWANAHKPSDMLTVGDVGSQAANIARDLMHLADIKILHGQKPEIAHDLDRMLGLGPQATAAMTGWAMQRKGRALWMVGEHPYKVETRLHPVEQQLTWTNEAIAGAA